MTDLSDPERAQRKRESILLVDDDLFGRKIVEIILRKAGYSVVVAIDGDDALDKARRTPPDLVISDVNMPRMNGFEFIKQFTSDRRFAQIPVIYLTSRQQESRTGIRLGATDYLLKPVDEDYLLDVVNVRLASRRSLLRRFHDETANLQNLVSRYLPHELITPLNGIVTSAAYMKDPDNDLTLEDAREFAGYIHASGMRLYSLAKRFAMLGQLDMIDEEEIRRERETAPMDATFLAPIIRQVCEAENRVGDLRLHLGSCSFRASVDRLECILEELVGNACKFSAKGTPIEVRSGIEKGRSYLEIKDRGDGMSAEEIAQIGLFRQFGRDRKEQQGLGLGLALAQRAARVCGLELSLKSEKGEGLAARIEG